MHWIENALANVNLEALNDVLIWTIHTLQVFDLDIGTGNSLFERTIPISEFSDAIFVLAYFIILAGTLLKLWITMMSPFDTAESPGAIIVRFSGALAGTMLSQRIFMLAEGAFNTIYSKFKDVYTKRADDYSKLIKNQYEAELNAQSAGDDGSGGGGNWWDWLMEKFKTPVSHEERISQRTNGTTQAAAEKAAEDDVFNLFGGDSLIADPNTPSQSLGILILELIIGCTLIISFFRLILEVYERYVLIGLMYYTAPLAFASIISSGSQIFRSWFQMLIGQFILMCSNLVFIGGFIGAWYNILSNIEKNGGYVFQTEQEYFTTMFALIGWLIIGQKFDQHLKGLGLSTAQTGAGIMGALAGGAIMARTALSAAGTAAGGVHKAAMGQTMAQKAYRDGTGIPGMLPGAGNGGDSGKGIGDKINDSVQTTGTSSTNQESQSSPAPRTEGENFNDAVNNAISGNGSSADAVTPIPAYSDSALRDNFDANTLKWSDSAAFPGAREAYDSAADQTLIVGTTAEANARIEDNYPKQIDVTSTEGKPMYIHAAKGNHVGSKTPPPMENATPRDKKKLIDRKNK